MSGERPYARKYVWSSIDFDNWIKQQQKQLRQEGTEIGTAEITHKVVHQLLIPQGITFLPPKIKKRGRGKFPRKLTF